MSYGHSYPPVFVPLTFVCQGDGCFAVVTIQVDAGKDYIWEDTVREGERYMIIHCHWRVEHRGSSVLCADCKPATESPH